MGSCVSLNPRRRRRGDGETATATATRRQVTSTSTVNQERQTNPNPTVCGGARTRTSTPIASTSTSTSFNGGVGIGLGVGAGITVKPRGQQRWLSNELELPVIKKQKPATKWSDVIGHEMAKDTLKEAGVFPTQFPQFYNDKRTPWRGILLYGPTGCGKSLLAKALTNDAVSTVFLLMSSEHYSGETDNLLEMLFSRGTAFAPCTVLLDEIDTLVTAIAASDKERENARKRRLELINQMRKVHQDDQGVLVLATTNKPWLLDPAVVKGFEKRIFISLPTKEERAQIFKASLGASRHCLIDENFQQLAEQTPGYSGSDIATIVRNALMVPIRKIYNATHFRMITGRSKVNPLEVDHGLFIPCSSVSPGAMRMTWDQVRPSTKLLEPAVTMGDVLHYLLATRPSVKAEELQRIACFAREHGEEAVTAV